MDLQEIKRLIYRGENDQVEFKHKVAHPEKVVREVVAFANAKGGHLIIGVDDDGRISGLKYADDDHYLLNKAIDELCKPKIQYTSEIIPISEKRSIIHYQIAEGKEKPYYAFLNKRHRYGKAFVRVEDRSVQASPEIRKILKLTQHENGSHIEYGNPERALFNYLNDHEDITINKYREMTGLEQKEASALFVRLVLANLLKIIPRENEDLFVAVD
ncbi:MAG: helix-turn-helix domain-containing protein [Bacteroidota bacterium]